jgi:hypothetical protein
MPSFDSTIQLDATELRNFKRALYYFKTVDKRIKIIQDAAKSAARPWSDILKQNMYNTVQRRTGKMARSIGVRNYQDKLTGRVGAKVGPSGARKIKGRGGGWRVHFFVTPAKQMKPKYKIPFQSIYSRRTRIVKARMLINLRRLVTAIMNGKAKSVRFL